MAPLMSIVRFDPSVTTPPTVEECLAFKKEIDATRVIYKPLMWGIGMTLGGGIAVGVGTLSLLGGSITLLGQHIQNGSSEFGENDVQPIIAIAGGETLAVIGFFSFLGGLFVSMIGALIAGFKPDLTPYAHAQLSYTLRDCGRILRQDAEEKLLAAELGEHDTAARIVFETSDTIPATINTPFEHPPMPEPWKVAAAHMMRDVGQSFLDAGQQLADDIVPIALTGAALAGGIVALRVGNTAPLQRALGF